MGLLLGGPEGASAHSVSGEKSSSEGTELRDVKAQQDRSTPATSPLFSLI